MPRRVRRERQRRIVRIEDHRIVRPGPGGDRAGIDRVLRLAVAVRGFDREAARHRLRQARRGGPRTSDALVQQDDVFGDHASGKVVEARLARAHAAGGRARSSEPARPGIGPGERRLRGGQIGVDVRHAIHVAVVDELAGAHQSPRQPPIDGDVGPPRLGKLEIGVRDGEVGARWRCAGDRRRLVGVGVRIERERGRGGDAVDEAGQHAGVADLVGDPHVRRFAGEHARAAAQLRPLIAEDIPVEADAGRPEGRFLRQRAGVVVDRVAALIAERQCVSRRVVVRGLAERGNIDPHAGGDGHVRPRPPLILCVPAGVPDIQRLDRLVQSRNVHVSDLEPSKRDRPRSVGVRVEVLQRVVHVDALLAGEEDVLGVVLLDRGAERQRVLVAEFRQTVLRLKRVVAQLVVRRERLGPKRRIGDAAAVQDVDERKQFVDRTAALVLMRVADDEVVRQVVAEDRVPLADARLDVLENRVVGVLEVQEVVREGLPSVAERR